MPVQRIANGVRQGAWIVLAVFAADLATKEWMLRLVFEPPRRIEITSFFNLVPVWNRGVSFGLLASDSPWSPYILAVMAGGIVLGLAFWLWRTERGLTRLALALAIGGAIGNLLDRLRFGAVVDFLDVHLAGYHWPAFNIADSAISIGIALLLIDSFREGRDNKALAHPPAGNDLDGKAGVKTPRDEN